MITRKNIEDEAAWIERLKHVSNPTGGAHTPTPWQKKDFEATGDCAIAAGDGTLIAMFKRREDRDLALYFANAHTGMIALFRNLAESFDFIAAGAKPEDEGLRHYATERAESTRIYADLFCRLGKVEGVEIDELQRPHPTKHQVTDDDANG
jgi:hypothetical protein